MFGEIMIQVSYYFIVLVLGVGMVSLLQRGFFWSFVKVKMSFGKLLMVKIRAVNRDHFKTGYIDEGQLVYKTSTGEKRLKIEQGYIYRALNVAWLDVDENKNAICKPDYSTVAGYDGEKMNDLYIRALYKPSLDDKHKKVVVALICLCILAVAISIYVSYQNSVLIKQVSSQVVSISQISKGIIMGA